MDSQYILFTLFVLLSVFNKLTLSKDTEKSIRKLLIQSSNDETFPLPVFSSHDSDPPDTNETWKATDFQIRNITSLLSDYPLLQNSSLPTKNSSRFFCSKKSTASLTISVKSFKHGIMFLNFSYFIGKLVASEPSTLTNKTLSNQNLSDASKLIDIKSIEATTSTTASLSSTISETTIAPMLGSSTPSPGPEFDQSSMSVSIYSPAKDPDISAQNLIKADSRRKRRSVILETENIPSSTALPSLTVQDDSKTEVKFHQVMTTEKNDKLDINENSAVPTTATSPLLTSSASNIDSLTLVQAVEMIKSAAAVISKGAVASTGSILNADPGTPPIAIGQEFHGTTENYDNEPISDQLKPTEKSLTTLPVTSTEDENDLDTNYTNQSDTLDESAEEETAQNNHRHKSKNGSNKLSKSGNKKKRNKSKKVDSVEQNENEGSPGEHDDPKDSSSSSEEENEETHEVELEEEKPKISYKMWRASLEKKNRPPGLYVTVNDDIIFDNWEGIWDKHYVLGKWTGSKASTNGKWNQTNLFMNWDSVAAGRDLTITFEWEPIDGEYELILSDVEISTIVSPETCNAPELKNPEELMKENLQRTSVEAQQKLDLTEDLNIETDHDHEESTIVLKRSKIEKGGWEIVRIGKAKSSNGEYFDGQQLEGSGPIKLEGKDTKADDVLRAILKRLPAYSFAELPHNTTPTTVEGATTLPLNEVVQYSTTEIENKLPDPVTSPLSVSTSTTAIPTSAPVNYSSSVNISLPLSSTSSSSSQINMDTSSVDSSVLSVTPTRTGLAPTSTTAAASSNLSATATENDPASVSPKLTTIAADTVTNSVPVSNPSTVEASNNSTEDTTTKKPIPRVWPKKKTDTRTALLVSLLTGGIALAILVVIIKKRIELSSKRKRNNNMRHNTFQLNNIR